LRTLPWERGINAQEHVLFWEDGDVDALLKGSLAYADAVEIRGKCQACDWDTLGLSLKIYGHAST